MYNQNPIFSYEQLSVHFNIYQKLQIYHKKINK